MENSRIYNFGNFPMRGGQPKSDIDFLQKRSSSQATSVLYYLFNVKNNVNCRDTSTFLYPEAPDFAYCIVVAYLLH